MSSPPPAPDSRGLSYMLIKNGLPGIFSNVGPSNTGANADAALLGDQAIEQFRRWTTQPTVFHNPYLEARDGRSCDTKTK
jgi:hypothetical protein